MRALVLVVLVACSSAPKPTNTAAEAAYSAELLRCVDQAKTLADSKACRKKVNEAWGIVEKETIK